MAGHFAIDQVKSKFSWGITSTNIRSLDRYYGGGQEYFPDWKKLKLQEGGEIQFDSLKFNWEKREKESFIEIHGGSEDFIYLRGWAVGSRERGLENTSVYIVFKNSAKEIVVPTRKKVRHDVARHLDSEEFVMAGWDSYISISAIEEGTYDIIIRFVDLINQEYNEYNTESIINFKGKAGSEKLRNHLGVNNEEKDFLGILGPFYIYFDKTALPRAYEVSKCQPFESLKEVVDGFISTTTFKLGNVYMEELSDEQKKFCRDLDQEVSRIPILHDRGKELLLEKVQGPTIIVLNDNVYPGWQAIDVVKGIPLQIKPGNITFRSLILPEDRKYQILFKYKPEWLPIAKVLVYIGFCLLFIPIAVAMRYRVSHNIHQ